MKSSPPITARFLNTMDDPLPLSEWIIHQKALATLIIDRSIYPITVHFSYPSYDLPILIVFQIKNLEFSL